MELRINCLVTGGAGFIGSHLSELLLQLGHSVISIDNLSTGSESNLDEFRNYKDFKFFNLDIKNKSLLREKFFQVDWVFHLAALADIVPSIETPDKYFEANVIGTYNIAELAHEFKVKKVVYAASSSCYGIPVKFPTSENSICNPKYPYALTKYIGEQILLHWAEVYNVNVTSLRLFNVYGPRARTTGSYGAVFGVFLAQKLAGKPFTVVGDGTQSRDFTYVTDVCKAFVSAAQTKVSERVFNVGSGNTYQINDLVRYLGGPVNYLPKRPAEPDCTFADISKITEMLDWKPEVTFRNGVAIMLDHINDFEDAPVWDIEKISIATRPWFKYLDKENL